MNKKGFISTALVYTFLLIFLLLMTTILASYVNRNNYIDKLTMEVKEELNDGVTNTFNKVAYNVTGGFVETSPGSGEYKLDDKFDEDPTNTHKGGSGTIPSPYIGISGVYTFNGAYVVNKDAYFPNIKYKFSPLLLL